MKISVKTTALMLFIFIAGQAAAQQKTESVFIITTDGFRWQELFGGADSALLNKKEYVRDRQKLVRTFWSDTLENRRKKLMPFFWNTIAKQGQLYGNRWLGNKANVMNPYWFSYPGYNEILTGFADDSVKSNDKIWNSNVSVLEFLNQQKALKGKVAAYATWDCFPYIINSQRSGIPVNAGLEQVTGNISEKEKILNEIQSTYPSLASNRHDFITYYLAKEYIRKNKPKAFFLAFDETDEFAHEAKYDEYLFAANTVDKFISDLWTYCQSTPQYKDRTTFIILTDHGRGDKNKTQWTSHGQKIADCYQIWTAVIGPDTPASGEMTSQDTIYQNQIAKTAAKLLGYDFVNGKEIGKVIESALKK